MTPTAAPAHPDLLLAAARAGDERAFRALVAPYTRAIEVHCYRMLGSLDDAEDVAQEALLRAWSGLARFERRASVKTWLYRIATNACLDELERRPRRPEPRVDPYPDERLLALADPVADPAARYARREGMELALLTAIQRLPGRQRAVLLLRDVLGWSSAETADLLDTTVAATNSALQRARATLEDVVPTLRAAPAPGAERELLRRYVAAWERSDMDALVALLQEDAVLTMPPQPTVCGAAAVGAFLGGVDRRTTLVAAGTWANGGPAVLLREADGRPHRLLVLEAAAGGERLAALHAYREPAVLSAFAG